MNRQAGFAGTALHNRGTRDRASGMPRLLAIMGSGETSPTMVKVHRQLLERLGPPPVPAVLLDTPFGFQENAREIAGQGGHLLPREPSGDHLRHRPRGRAPRTDRWRRAGGLRRRAADDQRSGTRVTSSRDPGARAMRFASGKEPSYRACSSRSSHTVVASCSRVPQR